MDGKSVVEIEKIVAVGWTVSRLVDSYFEMLDLVKGRAGLKTYPVGEADFESIRITEPVVGTAVQRCRQVLREIFKPLLVLENNTDQLEPDIYAYREEAVTYGVLPKYIAELNKCYDYIAHDHGSLRMPEWRNFTSIDDVHEAVKNTARGLFVGAVAQRLNERPFEAYDTFKKELSNFLDRFRGAFGVPDSEIPEPPPEASLVDYTTSLGRFTEVLSVAIDCTKLASKDADICRVYIRGPFGPDDSFSISVSKGDVDNFQRFGSIVVTYEPPEGYGHSYFLTQNTTSQTCEFYDPNGSSFKAEGIYPKLARALHRGLLRPLISPENVDPLAPFSVSLRSTAQGLQKVEARISEDLVLMFENEVGMPSSVSPQLRAHLKRYLNEGGFCYTWSLLMVVDKYKAELYFYDWLVAAYLNEDKDARKKVEYAALMAWQGRFYEELGVTQRVNKSGLVKNDFKEMLKSMLLPIFVRLLAEHFMQMRDRNLTLDSSDFEWTNPVKHETTDFHDLFKLIAPEERPLLDFDYKYDRASDLSMLHFPFPEPTQTDDPLCRFVVHTRLGVHSSIKNASRGSW